MPGPPELLIILAIVLVVFGASRLPGVSRALGESVTEFRKAMGGRDDDDDASSDDRTASTNDEA